MNLNISRIKTKNIILEKAEIDRIDIKTKIKNDFRKTDLKTIFVMKINFRNKKLIRTITSMIHSMISSHMRISIQMKNMTKKIQMFSTSII